MIPETGSRLEFKHCVLQEVDALWCLCCGEYTIYDPATADFHFCAECVARKRISWRQYGDRTALVLNVASVPMERMSALIAAWKKRCYDTGNRNQSRMQAMPDWERSHGILCELRG